MCGQLRGEPVGESDKGAAIVKIPKAFGLAVTNRDVSAVPGHTATLATLSAEPWRGAKRWHNMAMRLFALYAVIELAVIVALASTIGFGWTVLLLLSTFVVGLALAGSQVRRHVRRLQSGLTARTVHGAAADSVLVALGTVLVVIPGLASSALGALLLLPPTRAAARPVLTAMAARRLSVVAVGAPTHTPARGEYIDGEVIDVVDVEPPAVERKPE
jgi:UPF0716 protein FxsA